MKKISVFFALLVMFSCDKKQSKVTYSSDINSDRYIILKHQVSQTTEIEVGLDTAGSYRWKRVNVIRKYNKDGLLSELTVPHYVNDESISNSLKSKENRSLRDIENSILMSETNIPDGHADTIFYYYDNNNNLISEKDRTGTTTYKYDDKNNRTQRCYNSKNLETTCSFSIYEYEKDGRIIARTDSVGPISASRGHRYKNLNSRMPYEYDETGRVTYDGEVRVKFNSNNRIIEELTTHYKKIFTYNADGLKMKEEITYSSSRPWTNFIYYYYTDGLVSESKVLDANDKLVGLTNYEYKFY